MEDGLKKKHKKMPAEPAVPDQRIELFSRRLSGWIPFMGMILVAGLFFYYRLVVHPEYIRFAQQPVFFTEKRFWLEHLQVPGGFLDILAAYLTDLFQYGWLGAVILSALTLIAFLLIKAVMRAGSWWIAPLIPVLLLILVQTGYEYPISKTLSLMLALEGFILYRDGFPRKAGIRFGIALPFMVVVYVLSPGAMLLLVPLCVLYEGLNSGRPVITRILLPLGYSAAAVLLPFLASAAVFLVPLRDAFLRHALVWYGDGIHPLLGVKALTEGFLGLLILIFAGIFFVRGQEDREGGSPDHRIGLFQAFVAVVLLTAGVRLAVARDQKEVLSIRYAAHAGEWEDVVKRINSRTVQNPLCLFHFNRAFFHLGKMPSRLFSIPQNFGRYGLFLHNDLSFLYPLDRSDFSFEMGHVNEAKRWASEAATHFGESPDVLKRLALIHILQDDHAAAAQYLKRLRQNPNSRTWADHYLSCLAEPAKLHNEIFLQKIHADMPKRDFIVTSDHPEMDLEKILGQAPRNRMAFEYLMAACMISRDLNGFAKNLIRFRFFTEAELPRHYEEALITYLVLKKPVDEAARQIEIRKTTIDRFKDFERILSKHGGNSEAAYSELSLSYSDTYWFHILYARQVL
jgi:hypothetical protein